MHEKLTWTASLAFVLVGAAFPSTAYAQEKTEGTVVSTKLISCEFKPGGCEGSLVLETKGAGKSSQVSIKVPKGTLIKKGDETVYLPGLRGNLVSVTHVTEKGELVAKSIDVVQTAKR